MSSSPSKRTCDRRASSPPSAAHWRAKAPGAAWRRSRSSASKALAPASLAKPPGGSGALAWSRVQLAKQLDDVSGGLGEAARGPHPAETVADVVLLRASPRRPRPRRPRRRRPLRFFLSRGLCFSQQCLLASPLYCCATRWGGSQRVLQLGFAHFGSVLPAVVVERVRALNT